MASVDTGTVLPTHQGSWLVGFLASNNTTRLSVSRLFEHHARGWESNYIDKVISVITRIPHCVASAVRAYDDFCA